MELNSCSKKKERTYFNVHKAKERTYSLMVVLTKSSKSNSKEIHIMIGENLSTCPYVHAIGSQIDTST